MAGILFRRTKVKLSFKKDKPEMYKIAQIGLPPITFEQLCNEIGQTQGCTKAQTLAVVQAVINRALLFLANGQNVQLGGLGTLKPTFRSKTTRALSDADATTITERVIRYYPGKELKAMIAKIPISAAGKSYDVEDPSTI